MSAVVFNAASENFCLETKKDLQIYCDFGAFCCCLMPQVNVVDTGRFAVIMVSYSSLTN